MYFELSKHVYKITDMCKLKVYITKYTSTGEIALGVNIFAPYPWAGVFYTRGQILPQVVDAFTWRDYL